MVDWVADYLDSLEGVRVHPDVNRGDLRASLPETPPCQPDEIAEIDRDFIEQIVPGVAHWNHPGHFGYFHSSASEPAIVAELLAAALNTNCMVWRSSPAGTELEELVVDWLRQMMALPSSFSGLLFDGGSSSTFHALAAARQVADPAVREAGMVGRPRGLRLYATSMTHSSVTKAATTLGLGLAGVRLIDVDETSAMNAEALREAIHDDWRNGFTPCAVVATIGSTSTTGIDPVAAIADICEEEGVWLHVDAAQGGALALLPEKRALLKGWERADSIVVNPHNWMFVPLDASLLLTRRPDVLERAFSLVPDYLRPPGGTPDREFMDLGLPLGRRFRALKLWYTIRALGVHGIADRIRGHLALAGRFAQWVDDSKSFDRVAPVPMSTVCFRAVPPGLTGTALDRFNEELLELVNESGEVFLTHLRIDGRVALRIVISNLRTTERHVRRAWEILNECFGRMT